MLPDCEFVGQIGNGGVDHGFWGRPEEMTMNRFFLLMMRVKYCDDGMFSLVYTEHLKLFNSSHVLGLHTAFPATTLAPIWRVGGNKINFHLGFEF